MRIIDADALGVGRCSKDILPAAYCAGWNGLIELIEKAPTIDAVPVVRCRECIAYTPVDDNTGKCVFLIGKHQYVVPDGYCYLGERKVGSHLIVRNAAQR